MTLKTVNTRYLRLSMKMTVMGAGLLLLTVSLLSPTCWSTSATQRAAAARSLINDQKLTASDGTGIDFFGISVAVSGSTLVVGAPFDSIGTSSNQGSAYVFERHGGSWVETQKLIASDGAPGDLFGNSVTVSGSTIVVGADADDIGGNFEQGSAYVFNRHGGSWVETQKLIASDGAARDQFGSSVALSGSTLVVAAVIDTVGNNFAQASAYVFERHGGSWVETQQLTASDGEEFDQFGVSIAVSGATIVVGAPFDDVGPTFNQGSAYVFNRQGGSWVETEKLTASDGTPGDQFGWSVGVSGSTIVVGSINDTGDGNFLQGSAYVFNHQGGSWVETQKLTASDGEDSDAFGWSVAVSGSTIVVSALFNGNVNQGAAYVFNRQGGSWLETQKLIASDAVAVEFFGWSVAVSGSTVVVGAPSTDINGNVNQGAAYVFGP